MDWFIGLGMFIGIALFVRWWIGREDDSPTPGSKAKRPGGPDPRQK